MVVAVNYHHDTVNLPSHSTLLMWLSLMRLSRGDEKYIWHILSIRATRDFNVTFTSKKNGLLLDTMNSTGNQSLSENTRTSHASLTVRYFYNE